MDSRPCQTSLISRRQPERDGVGIDVACRVLQRQKSCRLVPISPAEETVFGELVASSGRIKRYSYKNSRPKRRHSARFSEAANCSPGQSILREGAPIVNRDQRSTRTDEPGLLAGSYRGNRRASAIVRSVRVCKTSKWSISKGKNHKSVVIAHNCERVHERSVASR